MLSTLPSMSAWYSPCVSSITWRDAQPHPFKDARVRVPDTRAECAGHAKTHLLGVRLVHALLLEAEPGHVQLG